MGTASDGDRRAFIGLDIGGHTIKGIRLERDGRISARAALPTPASSGAKAVLAAVTGVLTKLRALGEVSATGAGSPGGVDSQGRVAGEAANIAGWGGVDLRAAISKAAGSPAFVRNDGNLAAYAEWAARGLASERSGGYEALLFVGLGAGVGGGFVEGGRILGGVDDRALEIGHAIVYPEGRACACGRAGCAEAYASGPSIGRIAVKMAGLYDTPLSRLARAGTPIGAREVYAAHAKGDELAAAVHAVAAEALSRAVGQALAFLAPDTVVLGGGVLAGAPAFVADVARLAPLYAYAAAGAGVRFEAALLGTESGLLGAALYAAGSTLSRGELLELASSSAKAP
jgi:glucokinase